MRWRFVDFEYWSAAMNMGIDEAVCEGVKKGTSPPTIRLYGWKPSAVSIGAFQSMNEEVDYRNCVRLGVDVVRRRTGGGAVYHDQLGEVTYSVICPEDLVPVDINAAYREVCGRIVDALALLGVKGVFAPVNDVLVDGKKISGSAQSRRADIFLQHGTLLLSVDKKRMFKLLKVPPQKVQDKRLASPEERITSLREVSHASREEALKAMKTAFLKGRTWDEGSWRDDEIARARVLAEQRYASRDWNFSR
ncbi:MAG: lipoate--protein ligase family protein [Methanomassiliicoccales archaeon]|nr:lipoate--protein ligase family protein [Methanomassiliicoccales archaeon]